MIKQEEEKVVKSNNLGDFYRYVNKRLSYRSPIGCLINDKGDIITSDEVKANMFNIFELVPVVPQRSHSTCSLWQLDIISIISYVWSTTEIGPGADPVPVVHSRPASTY